MRFTCCKLGLAVALCAFALGVSAQQPAAPAPSGAAATSPSSGNSAAKQTHGTMKKNAAHHGAMHHGNRAMASAQETGPDSAYKAALRACVTGAQSARDSCIDEAISRYGHA